MISDVTGVTRIRMLYVQLLYRCNFACQHCFHGELLQAGDCYTPEQVDALLRHFHANYALRAVTFLGGEPLMYPHLTRVCRDAAQLGLGVEICSNGHFGFRRRLEAVAPHLDKLRISLEGLEATNDRIRKPGSFRSAIKTIALARSLGITVGVTMTVTALSLQDVLPLARILDRLGVTELKLHCLRPVGNAAHHPELAVHDDREYEALHQDLAAAGLGLQIRYDADLTPHTHSAQCRAGEPNRGDLDRIEIDPRGALTMSCKAVGRDAHAFRWDTTSQTVVYEPHDGDELHRHIPDVVYRTA